MPNSFPWLEDWSDFTKMVKDNPNFRPLTLEAWDRCKRMGVSEDYISCVRLTESELKAKQAENSTLISVTEPYLDLLNSTFAGKPHLIVLADKEGWILSLRGTPELFGGQENALVEGACWAEKCIGNNGIGTALYHKEPTFVYGVEHISSKYKNSACLGVPVFNDQDELLGALDVSVPVEDASPDRITLVLACAHSIESTLRKREKLENQLHQFERLVSTGTLLATTVHDLRNPMTIIRGVSQLGIMIAESEMEKEYFQRIIRQVDVLLELLGNLKGKDADETPEEVHPEVIIQEVLADLTPLFQIYDIKINANCSFTGTVTLHKDLFVRALHNLLRNAIQHMPNGGSILIQTGQLGSVFTLSIGDTGPGIPPEIKDNIFKPFVTGRGEGHGLGLYQVHYVVRKVHKGAIWFETETGKGTTFYIEIPLTKRDLVSEINFA